MSMKKSATIVVAGMMSLWLAGCGQTGGVQGTQSEPPAAETSVAETSAVEGTVTEESSAEAVRETQIDETAAAGQEEGSEPADTASEAQTEDTSQGQTQVGGYEDNFAVDSEAAAAFGTQIKDAVAAKDLEALADLAAYPLYVGFAEESVTPASREEFVALGADRIFTAELVESVGNADVNGLTPSMAGFVLSTDDGPNIIFSVVNGSLAVQGINY